MDIVLASAGFSTSAIAFVYIVFYVLKAMRGHRLVSYCCGAKADIGFDVRDIPPSPQGIQNLPTAPDVAGASEENLPAIASEATMHRAEKETSSTH
jgi:hypothetical protein